MRNIFDQYSQPENRVTHALLTAINEDRKLLGLFLRELVKVKAPINPRRLSVLEQQLPGEPEPRLDEEELERRGIPDGWITDEEGWCIFIESKVLSNVRSDQIRSQRRMAERLGFQSITAMAIAPLPQSVPAGTVPLEWRTVYAWLRRHRVDSAWAARAADYLEIAEAKLINSGQLVEGTLTKFTGFPFGREHPYTYLEAKRLLRLALDELRTRRDLISRLGMKPEVPGLKAITGRYGYGVWDFLWLFEPQKPRDSFTNYPHLTLSVGAQDVGAMVTVPNAVHTKVRRNLEQLGEDGFRALIEEVIDNLEPLLRDHKGAKPWCYGIQRRWEAIKSPPYDDARIGFDLRTAVSTTGPPKPNPRWVAIRGLRLLCQQGARELSDGDGRGFSLPTLPRAWATRRHRADRNSMAGLQAPRGSGAVILPISSVIGLENQLPLRSRALS